MNFQITDNNKNIQQLIKINKTFEETDCSFHQGKCKRNARRTASINAGESVKANGQGKVQPEAEDSRRPGFESGWEVLEAESSQKPNLRSIIRSPLESRAC
ncbi:hypothetical protein J6590_037780 [Homalodisca vitripennis]|nr:hypothetical protein J6590_037780 [Homalodisca vitripennis]